jgi:hypothetical protein
VGGQTPIKVEFCVTGEKRNLIAPPFWEKSPSKAKLKLILFSFSPSFNCTMKSN